MGKVTQEIKNKIIELYKNGCSSLEISKIVNISQPYISKIVKSENLTRDRNIPLSKDSELLDKVITLYNRGLGCDTISKKLNIPKHNIKYYVNREGITRKPKRNNNGEYNDFWFEDEKWYGYRECPNCGDKVLCYAQKPNLLLRNIKRKTKEGCLCKKCYGEKYSGEGNSFYGRRHNEESINKMLDSQNKVIKPVSKAEVEILETLIKLYDVIPQFIIEGKSYDFLLPKYNLIIEYHGDYWHCNPKIYDKDYINKKKGMKASDIWEYDLSKVELCSNNGYNLEVIWESDYKQNPNIILEKINKYE